MPMKPVKRGIKLWTRCDAKTGYVYDTRIYCGKEDSCQQGTLGERVVKTLCSTIRNQEVILVFDRFFTSTSLMHTLPFPAIGTYMKTRKCTPKLEANLKKGESEMAMAQGVLACHWKDTKHVLVMSNCHEPGEVLVKRRKKLASLARSHVQRPLQTITNTWAAWILPTRWLQCTNLTEKTESGGERYFFVCSW